MRTYKLILFGLCTLLTISLSAQTAYETVQYAQNTIGGTARSMGAANAFGALGADFGALSTNPAGLGLYRRSEFSITPSLSISDNTTQHYGQSNTENDYTFALNNLGVVFNVNRPPRQKRNGLIAASVALGINQLNNFHDERFIRGATSESSFVDYLTQRAQGTNVGQFTDPLVNNAFESYLFDPISNGQYQSILNGSEVTQEEFSRTTGMMQEFIFGFGLNYNDQWYFGANLGIPYSYLNQESVFTESDPENLNERFESVSVTENLETSSYGFNGKFGAIYRVNNNIRAGLAYHTPSFLRLTDNYSSNFNASALNTTENAFENFNFNDEDNIFNYRLRTPSKLVGSLALLSKKFGGFVSIDYELMNYGKSRYDAVIGNAEFRNFFADLNNEINDNFGWASNIRIGAEFARDIFRLRGGYAFLGNPLKSNSTQSGTHILTAGAGVHGRNAFLDLGFSSTLEDYTHNLYQTAAGSTVDSRLNNVAVTVGFKF